MTTLTNGATPLTLPDDLLWIDEFDWRPVQGRRTYTIAGAVVHDHGLKLTGRSITLQGGQEYGWVYRPALETLDEWAALPGQEFTLNYRGDDYTVRFDVEQQAVLAEPIIPYSDTDAADCFAVTLRFIGV